MDVAVFMFLYLRFGSYHRVALAALDETAQRARIVFLSLLPTSPFHYRLHVVKKFFRDDGLMFPFVKLFVVAEQAVIKGIGKDIRYPLAGHGLPALRHKAVLRKEVGYVLQAGIALGVEFKRGLHDLRARLMDDDGFPRSVIHVADGSKRRVFATLHFLIKAALGVRRQVEDKLIGHAELYAHQEHVVGGIIIPFVGADVLNSAALEKPTDLSAVHGVAGEPIQLPTDDTPRFAPFNTRQHFIEHGAARYFRGLLLYELRRDLKPLLLRQSPQHGKLILDRADLLIFNIG